MTRRNPPHSVQYLNKWVDSYAREIGQPPARVRNWVSYIILGGALETAGFEGSGRNFTIKGGVALELRLRHLARATRDLDLILNSETGDPIEELEGALSRPYRGFTFRRKGPPEVMPNGAARVQVALQYRGKPWGTVQVDVAWYAGDGAEVEMVEAISLAPFGIAGPESLPCLSLPYHVAQKIHGMTLPPPEGRRNERFRDLVDLLLLREWITDFDAVRQACRHVFEARRTHPWPPFIEVPEHWVAPFEQMASNLGLEVTDLYQAAIEVRQFISEIDDSAEWLSKTPIGGRITAATWYFVVDADGAIRRIPSQVGELLCLSDESDAVDIPADWQMDAGGVVLIGVVVILQNRKPLFIERTSLTCIALTDQMLEKPVQIDPEVWTNLAREILRQAQAPVRAVPALRVFLSRVQGALPCVLAPEVGVTIREVHKYFTQFRADQLLWNLRTSEPVHPIQPGPK